MAVDRTEEAPGGFDLLGLDDRLVQVLSTLGYEEPTPIQSEAIPPLLEGRDLLGQAATGTGKTAAFALPLLHQMAEAEERPSPAALVLVPTRELAMQVAEAVHRYGQGIGVRVLPVYGGQSFGQQLRVLKRGVDVVVATPGRALDHIDRGTLDLSGLRVAVLDEADEMLDMGFADDLEAILAATPGDRQTVLFSATMPPRIAAIARRHLKDPVQIRIAREQVPEGDAPLVRQTAYVVQRAHKLAALSRVLDVENPEAAIIFCRTRVDVDEVSQKLNAHGYRTEAIHGGMAQDQRDRVMNRLRGATVDLLVATDVAARGLDIARLTHVINYDLPNAAEAYVHRIGRVGRAGREGVAISLAQPREHRLLKNIEQLTKQRIQIAQVPSVADLRTRRMDVLRAALREELLGEELDHYRVVVESLAEEFDPMEIAMAAVKLARDATGGDVDEEMEIPQAALPREGPARGRSGSGDGNRRESGAKRRAKTQQRGGPRGSIARIYLGVGRDAGVRPKDLVGAITGETPVRGSQIGAIEIGDSFSIVEIEEGVAGEVLQALRRSKIKGRKVTVRRDRAGG